MTAGTAPGLALPEELLLLSFDPATGRKLCRHRFLQYGVAGAVLSELEPAGRIVAEHGRPAVANPVPPQDPLPAAALASLPPPGKVRAGQGPRAMRRLVREEWTALAVRRNVQRDRSVDGS